MGGFFSLQTHMADTTVTAGAAPAPMNVFARFIGIIFSPKDTFQNVAAHPRVLGILILICAVSAVLLGGFFATQVGQDAWLEVATRGREIPPQQMAMMEKMSRFAGPLAVGQAIVGVPIMLVIVAGILFAIFNAVMGGNATFKQVFAIVTHSWVVPVVSQLFTLPLSYMRGTISSATNLGVLLPMIDESSFLGHFLGSIDFFWIWTCIVLSIGLAVLYRRKTQSILVGFLSLYGVIALIIALVKS